MYSYVTRNTKIVMISLIIVLFLGGIALGFFLIKPEDAEAVTITAGSAEPQTLPAEETAEAPSGLDAGEIAELELPVPGADESLYVGSADFAEAQKFHMAFVLSADGSEIHDVTFFMDGLNVSVPDEGIQMFNMNVTESYKGTFPISAGIDIGSSHIKDLTITGETAHATLAYVYTYYGDAPVEIPFGETAMNFERISGSAASSPAAVPSAAYEAPASTADVTFEETTYTVAIGAVGLNDGGKTTVEITSPGIGEVIPFRNGEFVVPVQATIIIGGEPYHWNSVTTAADGLTFEFETDTMPEQIIVYPCGGDDDESVQVVFDAITKTVLTD